jgi:hypothetical protein
MWSRYREPRRGVAQSGSAFGWGPKGRWFKSSRPDMGTGSFAYDDELLARLQAPPDLCDGVEALAYWRTRLGRLPWYRRRARREASRMILVWERRVLAAVLAERGAPLWTRVRAARLVAAGPLRRWARRGGFVVGTATLVVLTAGLLAVDLLIRSI